MVASKFIKFKSILFTALLCGTLLCFVNCSRDDEPSSSHGTSSGSSSSGSTSGSTSSKKKAPTIEYFTITAAGGEINVYFKVLETEPEADVTLEYGTSSTDLSYTKSCRVYYPAHTPKGYTIYTSYIRGTGKYYFRGKASNKYGSNKTQVECRSGR